MGAAAVDRLVYAREELTASHPYARPHVEGAHTFHGGFLASGEYMPPRTLWRKPATAAWARALRARGWPLVDASRKAHPEDDYPNAAQHSLLLAHGCHGAFWDRLTITAVFEAKGETMCFIPQADLQALIEEDISQTATGHLWKGLFWSHGVDEAGDRNAPEGGGGHKQMWYAVRDLLFPDADRDRPVIPLMYPRPAPKREMPDLPEAVEKLLVICMGVVQVEVRSYAFSDLCLALCRNPANFRDRREDAELAARLVERIVLDEASHVAYLQTFVSELRSFTFKGMNGERIPGARIIDPVWTSLLNWPDAATINKRRMQLRADIAAEASEKMPADDAARLMQRFDALATA